MFHVGQRVVCVRTGRRSFDDCTYPVVGGIYTVRDIYAPPLGVDGPTGLRFVEFVNPPKLFNGFAIEIAFWDRCFRPIQERKTDISIFTEMLTPTKQRERA